MKKKLVTIFLLLFVAQNAYAENFTAGTALWSPYAMETEKGISGISVEILKEIVRRTGDTVSIKLYPAKRLNALFDKNELDINFADSPFWNRVTENPNFVFADEYMFVKEYIYFLKNRYIDVKSPLDLKGKTVAISAGYYYPIFEDSFKKGIVIKHEINSNRNLLQFFNAGRCDAAFFDNILFDYLLVDLNYDQTKFKRGLELGEVPLGLKIRKEKKISF